MEHLGNFKIVLGNILSMEQQKMQLKRLMTEIFCTPATNSRLSFSVTHSSKPFLTFPVSADASFPFKLCLSFFLCPDCKPLGIRPLLYKSLNFLNPTQYLVNSRHSMHICEVDLIAFPSGVSFLVFVEYH